MPHVRIEPLGACTYMHMCGGKQMNLAIAILLRYSLKMDTITLICNLYPTIQQYFSN